MRDARCLRVDPGATAKTQQGAIAFEMLRADIVSCRIAPGSSVSEAELAARYRLGKAAIRRALVRLSERGWVQALPRRGYLVKPITLRDIGEIFALRRMIEPVAVAPRGRPHRRQPAAPARCGVRRRLRRGRSGEPGDLPAGASPAASRDRHRRRQRAPDRRVRAAVGRERARDPSHRADAQPRRRAAARSCGADRGARDRARRRGRGGSRGRDRAAASRDRRCGAHDVEHAGAAARGSRAGRRRDRSGELGRQGGTAARSNNDGGLQWGGGRQGWVSRRWPQRCLPARRRPRRTCWWSIWCRSRRRSTRTCSGIPTATSSIATCSTTW